MTSEERREARHRRRTQRRRAKREARAAALGPLEEVYSYRKMFRHGRACCNGVRWKQSVQNFEAHLFSGTAARRRALLERRWQPKPGKHFTLQERGKVRPIDAPHIQDRQVQKSLCKEVLIPLYEPGMIWANGASRTGKGLHWQHDLLTQQLVRHYRKYGRAGAVLQIDLKGFFPNSPHSAVRAQHEKWLCREELIWAAERVLASNPSAERGRGQALGVEVSQQEMTMLPGPEDCWLLCQGRVEAAGHYMDDYYILGPDEAALRAVGRELVRRFERRGIPVNRKKCKVTPLTKPFRFCKVRFTLTETGKIKKNGSRMGIKAARRKLKLFCREWQEGKRDLETVAQYMQCQEAYYRNYNDHGRVLRLRRLCWALFGGRVRKCIASYRTKKERKLRWRVVSPGCAWTAAAAAMC